MLYLVFVLGIYLICGLIVTTVSVVIYGETTDFFDTWKAVGLALVWPVSILIAMIASIRGKKIFEN